MLKDIILIPCSYTNKSSECPIDDILLCQHHYNQVYRAISSNQERRKHKQCFICLSSMNNMEPQYCKNSSERGTHLELHVTEQSAIVGHVTDSLPR